MRTTSFDPCWSRILSAPPVFNLTRNIHFAAGAGFLYPAQQRSHHFQPVAGASGAFGPAPAGRLLVFRQRKIIADGLPEEIFADDELICRAGLKKPLLYQAAELLSRTGKEEEEKAGKAGEEDRSGKTGETRKTGGPGSAGRSAGKLPPDLPKTPEEFRRFLEKRIR